MALVPRVGFHSSGESVAARTGSFKIMSQLHKRSESTHCQWSDPVNYQSSSDIFSPAKLHSLKTPHPLQAAPMPRDQVLKYMSLLWAFIK